MKGEAAANEWTQRSEESLRVEAERLGQDERPQARRECAWYILGGPVVLGALGVFATPVGSHDPSLWDRMLNAGGMALVGAVLGLRLWPRDDD